MEGRGSVPFPLFLHLTGREKGQILFKDIEICYKCEEKAMKHKVSSPSSIYGLNISNLLDFRPYPIRLFTLGLDLKIIFPRSDGLFDLSLVLEKDETQLKSTLVVRKALSLFKILPTQVSRLSRRLP
jgi:hypothetical protein